MAGVEPDYAMREVVLRALEEGESQIEAARRAGVNKATVTKLIRNVMQFAEALAAGRAKRATMQRSEDEQVALKMLRDVVDGKVEGGPTTIVARVSAARVLLHHYEARRSHNRDPRSATKIAGEETAAARAAPRGQSDATAAPSPRGTDAEKLRVLKGQAEAAEYKARMEGRA